MTLVQSLVALLPHRGRLTDLPRLRVHDCLLSHRTEYALWLPPRHLSTSRVTKQAFLAVKVCSAALTRRQVLIRWLILQSLVNFELPGRQRILIIYVIVGTGPCADWPTHVRTVTLSSLALPSVRLFETRLFCGAKLRPRQLVCFVHWPKRYTNVLL